MCSAGADPRPSRATRGLPAPDALTDQKGQDWVDIVEFLTMHPEARRQVARLLAEIEARDQYPNKSTPSKGSPSL